MRNLEKSLLSPSSELGNGAGKAVSDEEFMLGTLDDGIQDGEPDRGSRGKSSVHRVSLNFINAVVGAGIVGLPYALEKAGLITGSILMLVVAFVTDRSVVMLVECGVKMRVCNYEELMETLFGTPGYLMLLVSLFFFDFGALLSYLIIAGDVSTDIVLGLTQGTSYEAGCLKDEWCVRRVCISGLALLVILPLCLFRNLERLERASMLSILSVVSVVVVVWTELLRGATPCDLRGTTDTCPDGHDLRRMFAGDNPFSAFGILAFSFVCHDTAFLLFATLRNPTPQRWRLASRRSLGTAAGICLFMAVPGYLSFRSSIKPDLLMSYGLHEPEIIAIRILYICTMCCTFPLSFFVCRHIENEVVGRLIEWYTGTVHTPGTPSAMPISRAPLPVHLALTLPLFLSAVGITMGVRDLGLVMGLTGSVFSTCVAFIFPPVCAIRIARLKRKDAGEEQPWAASEWLGPAALLLFG